MTRPRTAQKARTREALLDATRSLIADGIPVTVQRAADEAGISKATAYRYFSDPSLLVAEAGLKVGLEHRAGWVLGRRHLWGCGAKPVH